MSIKIPSFFFFYIFISLFAGSTLGGFLGFILCFRCLVVYDLLRVWIGFLSFSCDYEQWDGFGWHGSGAAICQHFCFCFVVRATCYSTWCSLLLCLCAWSAIIISLVVTYGRNHGFLVVYMETIWRDDPIGDAYNQSIDQSTINQSILGFKLILFLALINGMWLWFDLMLRKGFFLSCAGRISWWYHQ